MTTANLSKTLNYRRFIFWILAFGYVLVFFHRLCPAIVATDMMADLHASGALIGFLSSAVTIQHLSNHTFGLGADSNY